MDMSIIVLYLASQSCDTCIQSLLSRTNPQLTQKQRITLQCLWQYRLLNVSQTNSAAQPDIDEPLFSKS